MDDEHVIAPVPMGGQERLVALQHLGASFHEGRRRISKVATPADDMDDKIPTFMDDKCVDNDDQTTGSKHCHSPHYAKPKTLPDRIQ
ncbi:hypothetical protein LRAMOSA05691 [Lichtheimia ramosa]|uniref:Uncharacterized protein n=1 Tax=Lichtheimia ramosa TaxID=688394 RepID=A0A077X1T8_9FUNG|nr:hypothetical protein LRAMOSA05691 [Lichtheimia ramosa]